MHNHYFSFYRLTTELKSAHKTELQTLNDKIQNLEKHSTNLSARLELVTSERDRLQGYLTAIETEMKKTNSKLHISEMELRQARKGEANAKHQLIRCMKFIRELTASKKNVESQNLNECTDDSVDVEKVA